MENNDMVSKFLHYLNLDGELDHYDKIHEEIEKGVIFKGTNLWILIFAIVIASVGLNMNSTAVIIGAMLISPLMGPINGMGYSIATYNFPLLRQSLKNFLFAVGASLVASTMYFIISPISTAHSELLARTSPTIYDVLIALFGGLAGIVAISSRQKGNVIPGVAIATALMPPLCTAGYGLATGQANFFFGAFFLFTINTVFIAYSSVLISQILKFPFRTLVDAAQKKRVNQLISSVILLVAIPSVFFGYRLVLQEKFAEKAKAYVHNVSVYEGNYLLNHEVDAKKSRINLVYGGSALSEAQKEGIRAKAVDFGLPKATRIEFQQGLSFDFVSQMSNEAERLRAELNRLQLAMQEKDAHIAGLEGKPRIGEALLREVEILYPQITACSYAESATYGSDSSQAPLPIRMVVMENSGPELPASDRARLLAWLQKRLQSQQVALFVREAAKNTQ